MKMSQDDEEGMNLSHDAFVTVDKGRSRLKCLSKIDLPLNGMVSVDHCYGIFHEN